MTTVYQMPLPRSGAHPAALPGSERLTVEARTGRSQSAASAAYFF